MPFSECSPFILIGAQFAGAIVVHRWQTENRSTVGGKRTTDLKASRKLTLHCRAVMAGPVLCHDHRPCMRGAQLYER